MISQVVIDKLTQKELLFILKPYSDVLENTMFNEFPVSIKITKNKKYPHGEINMYIDMSKFNGQKNIPVGSIGPALYDEVVNNYYTLLSNKRNSKIDKVID